nr:unnamed protein product [Digitaria exilis]
MQACDETKKVVDVSSQMQEVVPCGIKQLTTVDMQEKDPQDQSSSDSHAENSFADLGFTCSSDKFDEFADKTQLCASQSSSKLSDRLKEISNTLKLLRTRPINILERKTDTQPSSTDVAEPKTPPAHLKFRHAKGLQESLMGHSTGIKGAATETHG